VKPRPLLRVHVCALVPHCRIHGAPRGRIYLKTRWGCLMLALRAEDRFADLDGPSRWIVWSKTPGN
jgi:hypothetical protein